MRYSNYDEAFNDIYPRIVRTLMVASGDKQLSSKIAQEAMGHAYAHWRKFQKLDAPINWVREIAIKKLREHIKNEEKEEGLTIDPLVDLTTFETLEKAIRTPYAIDFVRAVGNLQSEERIVATLTFIDDCSPSEIAKALGRDEDDVRTDIRNARVSIRHSMASIS